MTREVLLDIIINSRSGGAGCHGPFGEGCRAGNQRRALIFLVRCCCPENIELSYAKKREFDFDRGRNQLKEKIRYMSVISREVGHVNPSTKDQHPPQGSWWKRSSGASRREEKYYHVLLHFESDQASRKPGE